MNGQYPDNSMYEAPCLPWGATCEVDDGILVVELWLICATKYIAIDNTLFWPGVDPIGPTWSIGWSNQAQEPATIGLLIIAMNKHCFIQYVFVAYGAVARVNRVIPCVVPEYINHVSLAWLSDGYTQQHVPMLDSVVGGGLVDDLFPFFQCLPLGVQLQMRPIKRVISKTNKKSSLSVLKRGLGSLSSTRLLMGPSGNYLHLLLTRDRMFNWETFLLFS